MLWINIEQNTDEWFALRAGKVTGSAVSKVMSHFGNPFGEPAKKYAVDIAVEQLTGIPVESGYSNAHMERGHEEDEGRVQQQELRIGDPPAESQVEEDRTDEGENGEHEETKKECRYRGQKEEGGENIDEPGSGSPRCPLRHVV